MAQNDRGARVMSASALVASAIALLKSQPVQAGNTFTLDAATKELIAAIAAATGESLEAVQVILEQLQSNGGNQIVQGYPDNFPGGIIGRITFDQVPRAYQLPAIRIPDDVHLTLKAWPTNVLAPAVCYVGFSSLAVTSQLEQAWPLVPNESIGFRVQIASQLYVGGQNVGDMITYAAEQN